MSESPAQRLRTARELAGFGSAGGAARANGWSEGAYRHHENGTRNIPVKVADQYARAFGVSTGWLLGLSGEGERSYAEELQSALYTDDEIKRSRSVDSHIASKYGIALLNSVKLSALRGEATALEDPQFVIDISVLEQVAPRRSSTPLTFLAVRVDQKTGAHHIHEGAVLIVDRAGSRIRRQGVLALYTYAGEPGISRMYRHPDDTIELLDAWQGSSVRVDASDLELWGTVIWVGQPPE